MGLLWALASSAQSPSGLAHASQKKPSRVAAVAGDLGDRPAVTFGADKPAEST